MILSVKNIITIHLAWLHTAFSMAFRAVEIPFVLYFVAQSSDSLHQVSVLGIVLACLFLASGFTLPLTMVVVQGGSKQNVRYVFCWAMGLAVVGYFVAFLILKSQSNTVNTGLWAFHILAITGFLCVAIRRCFAGVLMIRNRTHMILVSSFMRIAVSVLLSLMLPATWASAIVGFAIMVFGAAVELAVMMVYRMCYKIRMTIAKTPPYMGAINYMKLCTTTLIYMCQNYIILWLLSMYNAHTPVSLWVVVFAFISLSTGLCMEISNVVLRYKIPPKQAWAIFIMPLIFCQSVVWVFLYTAWGKTLYFITFQNINDIAVLDTVRLPIAMLVTVFLIKEICKGFCLIHKKYAAIMTNSILNVVGLCIMGGIAISILPNTIPNTVIGTVILCGGLVLECTAYLWTVRNRL